jgi:hypothetical protein
MTRKLGKTTLAMVAAGLLVAGLSSGAQASVLATANASESNFRILGGNGVILNAATDFRFLTFTSTGAYSGTFPGSPGYNASSSATPVNLPVVCVGGGCGAFGAAYGLDNSFTNLAPPPIGNFSAADQNEAGSPIAGLAGLPPPALIQNGAYAQLTNGTGLSHAGSTNNLNALFGLTNPQTGGVITLTGLVSAFLDVFVSAGELAPGFATASYSVDFTLSDLTTGAVQVFSVDAFGNGVQTLSLNAPASGTLNQVAVATPFNHNFNVNNTDTYQLSARNNVNADVQRAVPEPGALALLGIGLVGLMMVMRRRYPTAAPGLGA